MKLYLVLLLVTTLLLCVASLPAQVKEDTIKVDTRLVSVPVIVSDRNGRYVPDLGEADFKVYQDGSEQPVAFFAAISEPITVAVLIDTSQSTHPVLGDIKDSAKAFIKLLSPQDRAMIVSFDYDIHVLSPLTADQRQLTDAVKHARIPDRLVGTMLRDAVYQTVSTSFKGINGRKAIIVLTDGKDAGSYIRVPELLNRLEESDTLVYTIMFKTENRPRDRAFGRGGVFGGGFPGGRGGMGRFPGRRFPGGGGNFPPDGERRRRVEERQKEQNANAADFLKDLSETTAGRFFTSKDGKLKNTFADILEELRLQYRLGFYPPDDDRPVLHQIRVKVGRENVVVRARGAYRSQAR